MPTVSPITPKPPLPLAMWRALRPRQWVKNVVLLPGILFTLDQPHPLSDWLRVLAGIAVFCVLSSATYLLNDAADVEADRAHPRKRLRPIAAGHLSISNAYGMAAALVAVGMGAAVALGIPFAVTALLYVLLTLAYSYSLKHHVLLDVMALSGCYILRAWAGTAVIGVSISQWLLICTTLGSLLIGLAKRRSELTTLEDAGAHRRSLNGYTLELLDQLINVVCASTLVAYMLYTFPALSKTAEHRPALMLTIPFVVYALFRFLYLIHRHGKGGDPTEEIVEDGGLRVAVILYLAAIVAIMLLPPFPF
jgi:4-hydroxybenzoate polyprenyltransferase